MNKADLQLELEALKDEVARLRAQMNVLAQYSPPLRICKSCHGYYVEGYLCACGHDNSVAEGEAEHGNKS